MDKGHYLCHARNFYIGYWTGDKFIYQRNKFGNTFEDYEYHWDSGSPFGTVKPIRKLTEDEING